jgi:hypothetical protein
VRKDWDRDCERGVGIFRRSIRLAHSRCPRGIRLVLFEFHETNLAKCRESPEFYASILWRRICGSNEGSSARFGCVVAERGSSSEESCCSKVVAGAPRDLCIEMAGAPAMRHCSRGTSVRHPAPRLFVRTILVSQRMIRRLRVTTRALFRYRLT